MSDALRRLEHSFGYVVVRPERIELWSTPAFGRERPDRLHRTIPVAQITSVTEGFRGVLGAQRTVDLRLASGDSVQFRLLPGSDAKEWIEALSVASPKRKTSGDASGLADLLSWLDRNPDASIGAVRAWCEARLISASD